tara:strand:- start:4122 stop:4724 length:603 start_codon:yes stop_codon:yes gene_type:complete
MSNYKQNHNLNQTENKELKKLINKKEQQELLFKTEALRPQPSIDREIEKFQLRNGQLTSLQEVKGLIREVVGKYNPMFPNSIPFFSLMYKLNSWHHLNPKDFTKPPVCALWIKQYIYGRFDKDVLPSLLKKENPIISGYIKKYKLFQFLNDEGLMFLERYINQAINVMNESENWYDFELKYTAKYNLSVQLKLISQQQTS